MLNMVRHVRLAGTATLLMIASAGPWAAPAPASVVFDLQTDYATGTFMRDARWLGLFCEQARCELRRTKVSITTGKAADINGTDEPIDVIKADGEPLALFAGTTLVPAKVDAWHQVAGSGGDLKIDAQRDALRSLGKWTVPGGATTLTISAVRLPEQKGFNYYLGDGVRKQLLLTTAADGDVPLNEPTVRWAGDLDGDGKLDLLIDASGNCDYDQRLFLSSLARARAHVGSAAVFQGVLPACGC